MGAKTTIAATIPAATHNTVAQSYGRNAAVMHMQAQQQITDTINLLRQIFKDATLGNPSDPNAVTIQTVINSLT